MDWVNDMKESLCRAGDHISLDVYTHIQPKEGGDLVSLKLAHELPKASKLYVTQYIKLYALENGVRVRKVTHRKFLIQFLTEEMV